MLELFPEGFEEIELPGEVELVAYTDSSGEERIWHAFGGAQSGAVGDGWQERWRQFHRPIRIGELWIGPPWEDPAPGALAVVIDPGRAFGTGAHATTRLCIELLSDLPRGSLVDLGCGSGVLSLVAARLGFAPVIAIDEDPQAIEATERNARANGVDLETRVADVLRDPLPDADVAVANVTLEVVRALVPRLVVDHAITSGYLAASRPSVAGFRSVGRREQEGWAADLLERTQ